jgi:ankyrin repeat protein
MAATHAQQAAKVKVMGEELEKAAYQGKTDEIFRLWLENGATLDVEYKGVSGATPLQYAAAYGHGEACRALVSTCGANVDSRTSSGSTPLIAAAFNNKLHCVEVLLELGADNTPKDHYGNKTALEWARAKGHAEVVALLEVAGRSPLIKSALKV